MTTEVNLIPALFPEQEVYCAYYSSLDGSVFDAIGALEVLGFGWRLDSYYAPVDDITEQKEYRLVAWRVVTSDCSLAVSPEVYTQTHD